MSNPSKPSSATSSPRSSPRAMSFSLLRTSWRTKTAIKSTLIPKVAKPSVLSSHALFLRRAGHSPHPRHLQQVLAAPRIQTLRITLDIGRHQTRELPGDQRRIPSSRVVDNTTRRANRHTLLHPGHPLGRVHWQPATDDRPAQTHPRLVRPQPSARRTGMAQQLTAHRGARRRQSPVDPQ